MLIVGYKNTSIHPLIFNARNSCKICKGEHFDTCTLIVNLPFYQDCIKIRNSEGYKKDVL